MSYIVKNNFAVQIILPTSVSFTEAEKYMPSDMQLVRSAEGCTVLDEVVEIEVTNYHTMLSSIRAMIDGAGEDQTPEEAPSTEGNLEAPESDATPEDYVLVGFVDSDNATVGFAADTYADIVSDYLPSNLEVKYAKGNQHKELEFRANTNFADEIEEALSMLNDVPLEEQYPELAEEESKEESKELLTGSDLDQKVAVEGDEISVKDIAKLQKVAQSKVAFYDAQIEELTNMLSQAKANSEDWQDAFKALERVGRLFETNR